MTTPKVFVTSATGCLGQAVARQLRALDCQVHTTTRDASSPAALALSALGVHLHEGSWDSTSTLTAALKGCTHLFLNLMPDFTNENSELAWGRTILSLARAAGVQHVVYSSGLPLKELPNYEKIPADFFFNAKMRQAKGELESLVSANEFNFESWTILRPGYFMANLLLPKVEFLYPGTLQAGGIFTFAYGSDELLPLIDPEDIARFAVAAFFDPKKFNGKEIRLASEKVPVKEVIKKVAEAAGRDIKARYLTEEEVEEALLTNPLLAAQKMSMGMANIVDVEEAKSWGVEMGTFDEFLVREAKAVEETYRSVPGRQSA
ncbi:hypothetical protein QBC43DRAFT_254145 [Cladorrhinum sp. PSN259]|nr:hypothetical protein QBC43DRAFT_254145 [Cladorrhinum sp. PSN259]